MPGTPKATQTPSSAGAVLTRLAAAASNNIRNNGNTIVSIVNGSGGTLTVTIPVQAADLDGLAIPDKTFTIANGAEKVAGPFSPGLYNYGDGTMDINLDATTSVTIAVLQVTTAS